MRKNRLPAKMSCKAGSQTRISCADSLKSAAMPVWVARRALKGILLFHSGC